MREVALHDGERLVEVDLDALRELGDQRLGLVERVLEVLALLAQELDVLRKARAFGFGKRIDWADAVTTTLEPLQASAQRGRVGVVAGRFEHAGLERRHHLIEARRELGPALFETGDGHESGSLALAELVDLVAQRDFVFGEAASRDPVAHSFLGFAGLVAQALDERFDVALQRFERRHHVGASLARPRHAA